MMEKKKTPVETESDKLSENSPVEAFEMPHRRELICHLTSEEIDLADRRIRDDYNHDSHYFAVGEEYDTGSLDKILREFPLGPGKRLTTTMTSYALTRLLMYNDSFQSFAESWAKFLNENARAVPNAKSSFVIIGLHSTTSMRTLNEAGFTRNHTRGAGHFALIHLNVRKSEVMVFDSLYGDGAPFEQSAYFLSGKIKKVVNGIHDQLRLSQNRKAEPVVWIQPKLQAQNGNDCGAHVLANAELLLQGCDPAYQKFTPETMRMIRRYHVLRKDNAIGDELRIKYSD